MIKISGRGLMRLGSVLALAVTGLISVSPAFAQYGSCRSDPVWALSNGDAVKTDAAIGDDVSYVSNVTFKAHIPTGTTVTRIAYGTTGPHETVQWVADQPANTYKVDILATDTAHTDATVSTTDTLLSASGAALQTGSGSGLVNTQYTDTLH